MPDTPAEPIELFRARGLPEAHAIRGMLEAAGIPARIDNELLQGVVGEVPMGWNTAPRILIDPAFETKARALLDEFLNQRSPDREDQTLNRCLACGGLMADAEVCPQCSWSYEGDSTEEEDNANAESGVDTESITTAAEQAVSEPVVLSSQTSSTTRRAMWAELTAVLAVGVIPNLSNAITSLSTSFPALPPWADAFQLIVASCCSIFVTLYLIHQSGESWQRFGLVRFSVWDILLGFILLLVAQIIFTRSVFFTLAGAPTLDRAPRPAVENLMMVVKYIFSGTAEEIVTRAYLITRLTELLRSRGWAVLVAGLLFGSYHLYQGWHDCMLVCIFGIAYGIAFLLIRRIWPLVIGHALYNIWLDLAS